MLQGSRFFFALLALLSVAFRPAAFAESPSQLTWHENQSVDASIESWPIKKLLGRIATLTGWKVYAESRLDGTVTVSFKNLPQGQALRLLLGSLNYALVPDGNNQSKLYVYRNSLGDATTLITADIKAKNWIANEIVLAVDPESNLDVEKLAEQLGGKVVAKSDEMNAYRLQFETAEEAAQAREKLAQRDDLDAQDNYAFDRPTMETAGSVSPSALFPIDPTPVTPGKQITVALVDTPIQPLDGKMKDFVLPSIDVGTTPGELPDSPTHATSMAQTILNSLAFSGSDKPGDLGTIRIQPVDIYGGASSTTTFEVALGLHKAIQTNPNVINLSLGGTGHSPMVEYLLQMAKQKDILVFASAGNSPTTDLTWPAASPHVIGVTAASYNGEIAPYANRGAFVDVKAPGLSRVHFNGRNYISTGTSTATAFVSGNAAARLANGHSAQATAAGILQTYNINNPAVTATPRR